MPRKDEIERMLILFYKSGNAHDEVNFTRYANWLDDLSMSGLLEMSNLLDRIRQDVLEEMWKRNQEGMRVYSRSYYERHPHTKMPPPIA